jgi:hypothetical protein
MALQPTNNWNSAYTWVGGHSNALSTIASMKGFNVTVGSVTSLTVATGYAPDRTASAKVSLTNSTFASINVSGVGGLDSGTKQSNTWYYVYVIANEAGTTNSVVISTNSVAPVYPAGYAYSRQVGHARTTATTNLLRSMQFGSAISKTVQYMEDRSVAPLHILSGGNATAFTALDATGLVPSGSRIVMGSANTTYGSGAAYNYLATKSYTNNATGTITLSSGKSFTSSGNYQIGNEDQFLYYLVTAATASCDLDVVGYIYDY